LTEADANHDLRFSSDMSYYVDTYSRVDLPTVSELRRTSDRSLVATLEKPDVSALLAAGFTYPEVFTSKARDGKTDIWGVIIRPTNFDPKKTYPVIENIYAGPHSSFVPKTFWPFGPHSSGDKVIGMQALAEMGFIVVQIDGTGTSNRSKAFHDVAWQNVGDAGFPDRILWHKASARRSLRQIVERRQRRQAAGAGAADRRRARHERRSGVNDAGSERADQGEQDVRPAGDSGRRPRRRPHQWPGRVRHAPPV
jgi:hypothetical protein